MYMEEELYQWCIKNKLTQSILHNHNEDIPNELRCSPIPRSFIGIES